MSAPFDIWDQATLTDLVVRPLTTQFEDQPRLGDLIAPLEDIQAMEAKLRVYETLAFGKGQFRAPDSTPALYKASQTWREEVIGLALLDEMERIMESQFQALSSSDETVRRAAGVDLVTRGRILQLRNERLTEYMRWQVFLNGTLTITYPSGQQMYVDYGFPAGHKPTVGTLWSNVTDSDPIADIRSWANTIAADSGHYGLRLHMSSDTYDLIVRNAKIKALLTATNRSMLLPTRDDIMTLLRDGTDIVLYDNGYRAENVGAANQSVSGTSRGLPTSLTRFLPYGKVLMTTDYVVDGQNIAETLNGQVTISTGYNTLAILQGPQAEVMVDHMTKQHYWRQASARIPRIFFPECFLAATVA